MAAAATAASANLIDSVAIDPRVHATIEVSNAEALPGAEVPATLNLANSGAVLTITGRASYLGSMFTSSTVRSWYAILEAQNSSGTWYPLAGAANAAAGYSPAGLPSISTGLAFSATPVSAYGVTYPTSGDKIVGTNLAGLTQASWNHSAVAELAPSSLATLLNSNSTPQIRLRVHIEALRKGLFGAQFVDVQQRVSTFGRMLRSQSGTATQVRLSLETDGAPARSFDSSTNPQLAALLSGSSASVATELPVPTVAPKGGESDGEYLARLRAAAESQTEANLSGSFTAGGAATPVCWWLLPDSDPLYDVGGARTLPIGGDAASVSAKLPVLEIAKSGPAEVDAGSSAGYEIAVANSGNANATAVVTDDVDGQAPANVPGFGPIAPGQDRTATHSVVVPSSLSGGQLHDRASVAWEDAAGNDYGPISADFTSRLITDTIPPAAPTLISSPPVLTNQTAATFEFAGEAGGTFRCALDGGAVQDCISPVAFTDLTDGNHTFTVFQTDDAGNAGSATSYAWSVDSAPPASPLLSGAPSGPTQSQSASIAISGESGASLTCSVDQAPPAACTSPVELSNLSEGEHSVSVVQVDGAGNESPAASASWIVDRTAPLAPHLDSTPDPLTNETQAGFGFTGESGGVFECRIDQTNYEACPNPKSYASLSEGPHEFFVRQVDDAGNVGQDVSFTWTIDTIGPNAPQITSAPAAISFERSASFVFGGEPGGGFECSLDGSTFIECQSPAEYSDIPLGSHDFAVRQADGAGNVGASSQHVWQIVSATPDPPTIVSGPRNPTNAPDAVFEVEPADGNTLECSIDGAEFAPCSSPVSFTALREGDHVFAARQRTGAGAISEPATYPWTVDTTAPDWPQFTTFTESVTTNSHIVVDWVSDGDGFMLCRAEFGEWSECAAPFDSGRLTPGDYSFGFRWQDDAGNVAFEFDLTWTLISPPPPEPPTIESAPSGITNSPTAQIQFAQSAGKAVECSVDGEEFDNCASPLDLVDLVDGQHSVALRAVDEGGQFSSVASVAWVVDTTAPDAPAITSSPDDDWPHSDSTFTFEGESGARFRCRIDGQPFRDCTSPKRYTLLSAGAHSFSVLQIDEAGNSSAPVSRVWNVTVDLETAVPDAPALDLTGVAPFVDRVDFLFSGDDAIQHGVDEGVITGKRAAVVRGEVKSTTDEPLPGVKVSVIGHPEFGETLSRDDGQVYMAVNGGGRLTLRFEKPGYPPVDRAVDVPWRDYAFVDDVVMTTLDPQVTPVHLSPDGESAQVAEGSTVVDEDGARRAAVLFPAGTTAELKFANGQSQPIEDLDVRITEFTVGDAGPDAMPAALPGTTAYTYASEFSADQAISAGADGVAFSKPAWAVLDNFMNIPAGTIVPNGFYDRGAPGWKAQDNGRVMKVLSVDEGVAVLDDGTGAPMGRPPVSDARHDAWPDLMAYVGQRFSAGQSFWLMPLEHFSIFDFNFLFGIPDDSESVPPVGEVSGTEDDPCIVKSSIIECENQTLGESIPLAGTSMSLNYRSDRAPGRVDRSRYEVRLTDADPAASLEQVELSVDIAGVRKEYTFAPTPNGRFTFEWNGLDWAGRQMVGTHNARFILTHVYPVTMGAPSEASSRAWARVVRDTDLDVRRGAAKALVQRSFEIHLNAPLSDTTNWQTESLAGWDLSPHHRFDPLSQTTLRGDGTRVHPDELSETFSHFAGLEQSGGGGGGEENSLNGPLFDADAVASIRPTSMLRPFISMLPIAAVGAPDQTDPYGIGDGGQARDAQLGEVQAMAVSSDGSVYAAERLWNSDQQRSASRIRRIDPDGIITTVAGNGEYGEDGDGGAATDAQITTVSAMAVGHRGELYFAQGHRVRRIETDGTISTFAGQVQQGNGLPTGDNGPATEALLYSPECLAVGVDGSLFICDTSPASIRQVDVSGTIFTVSDLQTSPNSGIIPHSMAIDSKGVMYVGGDYKLLRIDPVDYSVTVRENLFDRPLLRNPCVSGVGIAPDDRVYMLIAENFAAGCERRYGYTYLSHPRDGLRRLVSGDGGNPNMTGVEAGYALTLTGAPDGDLYSSLGSQIWHYGATFTDHMPDGAIVPEPSGDVAHRFDASGRHIETTSTTTGATLKSFAYDAENRLIGVTDANGNTTTIERNPQGDPTAIIAPFGQRTELAIGADGLLSSVTTPGGRSTEMMYDSKGLLQTFTKPNGATSTFVYDGVGRLLSDADATGSAKTLDMVGVDAEYSVTLRSAAGREKVVTHRSLPDGGSERVIQHPSGNESRRLERTDGSKRVTLPDGTVIQTTTLPDDRYGSAVQVPSTATVTTPGGLSTQVETNVEHDVSAWWNPFSWNTETTTTSVNGKTSTSVLSKDTQTVESFSSAGRSSTSTFDDAERPTTLVIPGMAQLSFTYDSNGRLTQATQGSRASSFAYNAAGNLAEATDALGRTTSYEYDNDGLVTSTTLPGGREVQFTYDANGNMTSLTPPSRPAHEFSYDILGLMTGATAPEVSTTPRTTTYEYETQDHDLTEITRPSGAQAQLSYDSGGRLDEMVTPDGTTSLTYNATTGKPASISGPGGQQIAFEHDGSLPTSQTMTGQVAGSSSLTYNNDFQLTTATAAGSQIGFTYDADGLLTGAGDLSLGRDAGNGAVNAVTLGTLATSITYDQYGDPTAIDTDSVGSDVHNVTFTRDAGGRIVTKQETRGATTTTWAYNYNAAGQLENVMKDGDQYAAYTYDANGNRTSKVDSSGTTLATFDARDRMVTHGDLDLTYNENGELTEKQNRVNGDTLSLQYTTLGDLKSATTVDGHDIDYVLDPLGRRIGKRVDGNLEQGFLYSPEAFGPVAELDENNDLVSRFVYTGSHVPAFMVKNGTTYRLVTDQLGSVVMVVDASNGAVAQELSYGPFGAVLSDSNPGFQPFGFAGGIYDVDTGLTHFGAREYDAGLGRWTASDPIGFGGGDSNLYGYVLQDPVNFVDPSGLWAMNIPNPLGPMERWIGDKLDAVASMFEKRCGKTYWQRVKDNFNTTNDYLWSLMAPTPLGFLTGGKMAHALGWDSLWDWAKAIYKDPRKIVDLARAAPRLLVSGSVNWVAAGAAFEAGVAAGSLLRATWSCDCG